MSDEQRLRELLHDPAWSLPRWPPAQALARIRRTARRQRLIMAGKSAAVAVVVGASVLVAVSAAANGALPLWTRRSDAAGPHRSPPHRVPPVGSSGFPAAIYPAAISPHAGQRGAAPCPAPSGLRAPGPATPARALAVLRSADAGLARQLRVTDRALWPELASRHRTAILPILRAARSSVRYSGPLRAGIGELAAVRQAITASCGDRVMRATWVIVSGVPGRPSQDAELLFLTRHSQLLLYQIQ